MKQLLITSILVLLTSVATTAIILDQPLANEMRINNGLKSKQMTLTATTASPPKAFNYTKMVWNHLVKSKGKMKPQTVLTPPQIAALSSGMSMNAKADRELTPAQDRIFIPPYKFPMWGLPYGIYSNGGFFNPGLFPFVPGGPAFPPYDGIFGGPFGPGDFPTPKTTSTTAKPPDTKKSSVDFQIQNQNRSTKRNARNFEAQQEPNRQGLAMPSYGPSVSSYSGSIPQMYPPQRIYNNPIGSYSNYPPISTISSPYAFGYSGVYPYKSYPAQAPKETTTKKSPKKKLPIKKRRHYKKRSHDHHDHNGESDCDETEGCCSNCGTKTDNDDEIDNEDGSSNEIADLETSDSSPVVKTVAAAEPHDLLSFMAQYLKAAVTYPHLFGLTGTSPNSNGILNEETTTTAATTDTSSTTTTTPSSIFNQAQIQLPVTVTNSNSNEMLGKIIMGEDKSANDTFPRSSEANISVDQAQAAVSLIQPFSGSPLQNQRIDSENILVQDKIQNQQFQNSAQQLPTSNQLFQNSNPQLPNSNQQLVLNHYLQNMIQYLHDTNLQLQNQQFKNPNQQFEPPEQEFQNQQIENNPPFQQQNQMENRQYQINPHFESQPMQNPQFQNEIQNQQLLDSSSQSQWTPRSAYSSSRAIRNLYDPLEIKGEDPVLQPPPEPYTNYGENIPLGSNFEITNSFKPSVQFRQPEIPYNVQSGRDSNQPSFTAPYAEIHVKQSLVEQQPFEEAHFSNVNLPSQNIPQMVMEARSDFDPLITQESQISSNFYAPQQYYSQQQFQNQNDQLKFRASPQDRTNEPQTDFRNYNNYNPLEIQNTRSYDDAVEMSYQNNNQYQNQNQNQNQNYEEPQITVTQIEAQHYSPSDSFIPEEAPYHHIPFDTHIGYNYLADSV